MPAIACAPSKPSARQSAWRLRVRPSALLRRKAWSDSRRPTPSRPSGILLDTEKEPVITELLARVRTGDRAALDQLTPLVYDQLRRIAQGCIRGENAGLTLQATSLVHEAWMRLSGTSH